MSIPGNRKDREQSKFVESQSVPGKAVVSVTNPDGSDIASSVPSGASTEAKQAEILAELEQKLEPSDISGLAKESKQLPNDHDVTVSNQITGFSTSAKQDTAKAVLDNIKTNTDNLIASPSTEAKQDDVITEIKPLSTLVTTAVTLVTAGTAYKLPNTEQSDRRTIIVYNVSDTDVFLGDSDVTTTTGILLASGGSMSLDISANLYAVCGTDSKIVNVLEMK